MQTPAKIRQLMPEGFGPLLASETGCTDPSAISRLVNYEQFKNKKWPAVLALAEKTAPAAFALWAAANPEKLPKVAA
jgi:hypothetical protein